MKRRLYVIFDLESHDYGDVLALGTDEEAKRFFIHSCVNCEWYKDLILMYVGDIDVNENIHSPTIEPCTIGNTTICTGKEVTEEVEELVKQRLELSAIQSEIAKTLRQPQFVEDVVKLSCYLQKNDKKRFNK